MHVNQRGAAYSYNIAIAHNIHFIGRYSRFFSCFIINILQKKPNDADIFDNLC